MEKERVEQPGFVRKRFSLSAQNKLHEEALANLFKTSNPQPLVKRMGSVKEARQKLARGRSWRKSLAESILAKKKGSTGDEAESNESKTRVVPTSNVEKVQNSGNNKLKTNSDAAVQKAKESFLQSRLRRREIRRRLSKDRLKDSAGVATSTPKSSTTKSSTSCTKKSVPNSPTDRAELKAKLKRKRKKKSLKKKKTKKPDSEKGIATSTSVNENFNTTKPSKPPIEKSGLENKLATSEAAKILSSMPAKMTAVVPEDIEEYGDLPQ